jgi:hypothetical protein
MALSRRQSRAGARLILLVGCVLGTLHTASCATGVDPPARDTPPRGGSAGSTNGGAGGSGGNGATGGSGGSGGFGGSGAFNSGGSVAFGPGGASGSAGTSGAGGSAGSGGTGGTLATGGTGGASGSAGTSGAGSGGSAGTSGSGGSAGTGGASGAGGAGGSDPSHCLFNWRDDATCGPKCTNAQPPQSDVRACAEVLDCWLSRNCGPSSCPTKPGTQDQYCGPNDIQKGGAPYPPAQAVWDCLMCP